VPVSVRSAVAIGRQDALERELFRITSTSKYVEFVIVCQYLPY
jgi:hypothetical protein